MLEKHRPPHHHCLESALSPCSSMRQKSFPTRWVPLLPLTRSYPQRREVHAKKYLNNHKIKKKMKRKLRRDGSKIHTRQILLVLFREYAATEIQVFKYLNCFSSLNLTTSSSPQRFFTRDVKSYLYASERGIRKFEVRFLMGTQNFLFVPRCDKTKKNTFLYFSTELKTYHLSYLYLQTLRYRHC